MDADTMREHLLGKPGAWLDHPFDPVWPVAKVGQPERFKIFAFLRADGVGVKAGRSREEADSWLERYPGAVRVMSHIGHHGWNDLSFVGGDDGSEAPIPDDELLDAVDASYALVLQGLPRKFRPTGWEQ